MKITLYVGGERLIVEPAEAASILARFERDCDGNEAYKIDLSCRSWKRESLDIIQPFLEKNAGSVRQLNLADIIAGRLTDEGLGVTETLAKTFESSDLIEIELSDNAMGPRGLLRVGSLFANSHLQRLYLDNCGLSAESLEMLKTSVLADNGRIAQSLTELVLDRNMTGVEGAKRVAEFLPHCKNLEYLSYCGCRPIKEGTKHLADGILGITRDCQPALRRLDLQDCTFGSGEDDDDAIIPLAEGLKKCCQLQYLNLSDGDLEVAGLTLLVDSLKTSKARLSHLYLDGCGELGTDGARVLADYLQTQATTLRSLHANFVELGDEGVCILLEPFSASRNVLEELSLQQNDIEETGAEALVRAILPNLKFMNLEDNDEMPKKHLKLKYAEKVVFGEEEDDDEEEEEGSTEDMDALISQLAGASL